MVCRSVRLPVTTVSLAKAAEPIEMQFGILSRVGPENHVLNRGGDAPHGKGHFWGAWLIEMHCKRRIFGVGQKGELCQIGYGPILTLCTSYEVFLRNDVLFGNTVDNAVHLGSRIEDNTAEVGRE